MKYVDDTKEDKEAEEEEEGEEDEKEEGEGEEEEKEEEEGEEDEKEEEEEDEKAEEDKEDKEDEEDKEMPLAVKFKPPKGKDPSLAQDHFQVKGPSKLTPPPQPPKKKIGKIPNKANNHVFNSELKNIKMGRERPATCNFVKGTKSSGRQGGNEPAEKHIGVSKLIEAWQANLKEADLSQVHQVGKQKHVEEEPTAEGSKNTKRLKFTSMWRKS